MRVKPFRIKSAVLLNSTTGDEKPLSFYSSTDTDTDLVQLTIKESMFSPSLEGEALIRDYSRTIEGINLTIGSYDTLRIRMEQVDENKQSKEFIVDLSIYAYSQETSEAEVQIGQKNIARLISLKLASKEHYIMNYNFFEFMDDDKVMKISYNPDPNQDSSRTRGSSGDNKGIVQYLIDRISAAMKGEGAPNKPKILPLKADNTRNWIWLKKNHNFYPWGKFIKPPRLSQLMQLLAENAVDETNNNAINFFFWQDIENWNFRSVESIITEYAGKDLKTYFVGPRMNDANSVRSLESGSEDEIHVSSSEETDFFDLLRSYAFGSLYTFVEPKYKQDPYARYLDTQDGHIYQDIYYDYFEDKDRWLKVEGDVRLKKTIDGKENLLIKNIGQNLIVDTKYGYFSPNFFNKKKTVDWEYNGYRYSNRDEEDLWQTQFDITDMKGEELKIIQEKIKKPLKKKKEEYARKKNLKEKWKVYKCSICCAGDLGVIGPVGSIPGASGTGFTGFTDPRFEKSFNLRNSSSRLSNYEVVAAGSFTDVINFDRAKIGFIGGSGESGGASGGASGSILDPWAASGMTLSYNLNESPYNLSLGEFFSLEKKPDNFIKYRFDLEIKRHEKLKEILQNNISARNARVAGYSGAVAGYSGAYLARTNVCNQTGCTGYCVCPTEYPEIVTTRANLISGAHDALSKHEEEILKLIQPNIDKLNRLKQEFIELYDKYWSRNAFFFSRNIDFSFLKAKNNLFNVKSITRRSIKGSKYEPFAVRKALTGVTLQSGQSGQSGQSSRYPYAVPPFFGDLGEANACDSIKNAGFENNIAGITVDVYYGRKYDNYEQEFDDGTKSKSPSADFWSSFEAPFSNFPYSENNEEKAKGPIWYRNWLVNYDITLIKPPCLNRKPPCFQGEDCSCDEIILPMKMHFETFANGITADILTGTTLINEYAYTQLLKNCDGCKIRITNTVPSSAIKLYHPWAADELTGTGGEPLGFSADEYVNYKKAASLFKDKPGLTGFYDNDPSNDLYNDFDGWTPPNLLLEGLESYVRVEFMTPIGTETLKDFPEGFIDTYGSEYFLPYIVLATAGPFGSQSARANISVIGQDPFGFDLAVKKIKNRDDFAGMNLVYNESLDGDVGDPNQSYPGFPGEADKKYSYPDQRFPFATSSSWMKNTQNSLFYKPKDGIADLFVPTGIQDIFKASSLEKSLPAKTWWDMWVSLPPVAVATFYNRWDVIGASGGSLRQGEGDFDKWFSNSASFSKATGQGVGFYFNNSIVAYPYVFTGGVGTGGCSGGCSSDAPWPLFLQPDTEQIISGAFPYNVAVQTPDDLLNSFGNLGNFFFTLDPALGVCGGQSGGSSGASRILPSDPSNYIYNFAEFPHITGLPASGSSPEVMGIQRGLNYPVISYPVGTLIWGKNIPKKIPADHCITALAGLSGSTGLSDHNVVHMYDISRKTQYGLVQLSSDSMPSIITMIGGVGGSIQKAEQYNRWISDKLVDWFQNTIFDNNFSAQFVVLSKQEGYCKGYDCMNPDGFTGIQGCPPSNPLCNCPCQGEGANKGKLLSTYVVPGSSGAEMPKELVLRPDLMDIVPDRFFGGVTFAPTGSYGPEPSALELEILEKQLSECDLIKKHLGEEWLGCVWDNPNSSYNCSCPKIGRKFPDYMKYNRTYATFWDTPLAAPLLRTAQMALLNSNKITISVAGDFDVKPGQIINITSVNVQNKRFRGKWLVTTVNRFFNRAYHMMNLTLSREGSPLDPDEEKEDNL